MKNDLDCYTADELKVMVYDANVLLNQTAHQIELLNQAISRKIHNQELSPKKNDENLASETEPNPDQ